MTLISKKQRFQLQRCSNLLEVVAQLDDRDAAEHPALAHIQAAILQRVYVAPDEQEIRTGFHG
jgi:hypothetical protein